MFRNYLKIVFRNFKKQKIYSVINIAGLSVGLACAIVVLLIVKREYAVNRNFSKAGQLYRVGSDWKTAGMGNSISTLAPVGPLLKGAFPEVENFNRFWGGWVVLNVDEKAFREDMLIADTTFFHLFDFPFLAGTPGTAFQQPNSVVITEALAQKCFGTTDVLGQTITFQLWNGEGKREYKVTGLLKKLPRTTVTHFSDEGFNVFISTRNLEDFLDHRAFESWNSRYMVTYILLQPGTDVEALQAKLPALLDEHCPDELRPNIELKLEPITEIHLTDFGGQVQKTLKGHILFAVLMILIACINFINLSTARAAQREKEIGVRKVLGSTRIELVKQFLTEAIVFAILALLLSLGFAEIFIRAFHDLAARDIEFNFVAQRDVLLTLLGLTLLTGILAGAYPAFFLSSFRPVQAVRGGLRTGKGAAVIRKILVVAQFIATVFLLIAATVISRQLHFMMNRDLGFDQENILVIQSMPREWNFNGVKKQEVLKDALVRIPEITAATLSFDVPADYGSGSLEISMPNLPLGQTVTATQFTVDESYLEAFNLKLEAGRFFSKAFFHADTANAVVLNQAAAEALALQNPVGEFVTLSGGHDFRVIGVVENFSFFPLERDDKPLAFLYVYGVPIYRYLSLKLRSEDVVGAIARIKSAWYEVYPDVPFEYQFIDQVVQLQYGEIEKMQTISRYATALAIFVACLGLFGLVAYAAEQRTKEIGIRKVLGATVANVVALLSKDFVKLVLLANLIAWPVAWYAMNKWLQNFAYRIEISWWVFALAGGLALVIALLTVSTQAVRAALANPVDSLRYE